MWVVWRSSCCESVFVVVVELWVVVFCCCGFVVVVSGRVCVVVCDVVVMNSLVRVVRVVAVLDSCVCMYVGTRGRSWCLEFFGLCSLCCVCCSLLQRCAVVLVSRNCVVRWFLLWLLNCLCVFVVVLLRVMELLVWFWCKIVGVLCCCVWCVGCGLCSTYCLCIVAVMVWYVWVVSVIAVMNSYVSDEVHDAWSLVRK